jgi:uncharacterized protein YukE
MGKIHMQTDDIYELARLLQRSAEQIQRSKASLDSAERRLGQAWNGSRADRFRDDLRWNLRQIEEISFRIEELARSTNYEVEQWLDADSLGSQRLKTPPLFKPVLHPLDPVTGHAAYFLIAGTQIQGYRGILAGTGISDEELGEFIDKDPFKPEIIEVKSTIFNEEGSAAWAVMDGRAATQFGTFEGSLASAEAKGSYGASFGKGGVGVDASGEVGAYLAKGSYNTEVLGAAVAATAFAGANIKGEARVALDPLKGELGASAGVDAFVGAKAEASITEEIDVVDGVKAKGTVRGGVSYGLGATAKGELGLHEGHFKLEGQYGLTVGLGAQFGVSIDIDVSGAVKNIVENARAAVETL